MEIPPTMICITGGGGNVPVEPEDTTTPTLILHLEDVTTSTAINLGQCVLSGEPYNIDVDWCDGSEVEHYEGSTGQPTIKHTYSTAGNQQIKITGNLGWYGDTSSTGLLRSYLVGIEIKNSSPLTRVSDSAFIYYQKLRTIDGKMFENCVSQTSFYCTFILCASLSSDNFPLDLFKYNTAVILWSLFHTAGHASITKLSYNDYSSPNYEYGIAYNCPAVKEICIWNVMSEDRLTKIINELPTLSGDGKFYLGVTPGIEGALESFGTQEAALNAKGWNFAGVLR